jgi:hypothetical protein
MSETAAVVNNVVDKFGNGMDRLITDAEKFATEFIKRVDTIAPQIAAELKTIGLYAWKCLVRQQIAEGIFYSIAGVALLIILWFYFKLLVKPYCYDGKFRDPSEGALTFLSMCMIAGCLIGSGAFLFNGITHLISPEYYAAEELLEKIKMMQSHY